MLPPDYPEKILRAHVWTLCESGNPKFVQIGEALEDDLRSLTQHPTEQSNVRVAQVLGLLSRLNADPLLSRVLPKLKSTAPFESLATIRAEAILCTQGQDYVVAQSGVIRTHAEALLEQMRAELVWNDVAEYPLATERRRLFQELTGQWSYMLAGMGPPFDHDGARDPHFPPERSVCGSIVNRSPVTEALFWRLVDPRDGWFRLSTGQEPEVVAMVRPRGDELCVREQGVVKMYQSPNAEVLAQEVESTVESFMPFTFAEGALMSDALTLFPEVASRLHRLQAEAPLATSLYALDDECEAGAAEEVDPLSSALDAIEETTGQAVQHLG